MPIIDSEEGEARLVLVENREGVLSLLEEVVQWKSTCSSDFFGPYPILEFPLITVSLHNQLPGTEGRDITIPQHILKERFLLRLVVLPSMLSPLAIGVYFGFSDAEETEHLN